MANNQPIGIIHEQGFVAGMGLGFETMNEQDTKKFNKDKKSPENKEKK